MYFILRISTKAFIRLSEDSNDIIVVQDPERSSKFDSIGDAMVTAARINDDWEEHIVKVVKVG